MLMVLLEIVPQLVLLLLKATRHLVGVAIQILALLSGRWPAMQQVTMLLRKLPIERTLNAGCNFHMALWIFAER